MENKILTHYFSKAAEILASRERYGMTSWTAT
jgi:hypothetical protein